MALFKQKKEEKKPVVKDVVVQKAALPSSERVFHGVVLSRPRITEKATESAERGVYVFEVDTNANKKEIAEGVKELYGVTPRKVRVTQIPQKTVMSRTRRTRGIKKGGKKAYVYLKKGDTIEIV